MKRLLKNGYVINVFTDEILKTNVLIEDDLIIGVGDYEKADIIEDLTNKYLVPGFIDAHLHIESTMMVPSSFAKIALLHGITTVIADPHEIANVLGSEGIELMIKLSEGLPLNVYYMLPSCVPATKFCESKMSLNANELHKFYKYPSVLGLGEVMNFHGVINQDRDLVKKINDAKKLNKTIDGHAPLLSNQDLDKYICAGIKNDHECSNFIEAKEKIRKGQTIFIRQGTAARNVEKLIDLFDSPFNYHACLCTDDKHPYDIINEGLIDAIIRKAKTFNKSILASIRMASIQAAKHYNLKERGAIAPGYKADILVLNNLDNIDILDVYTNGNKIVSNKNICDFKVKDVESNLLKRALNSLNVPFQKEEDFYIQPLGKKCHIIQTIKGELLTNDVVQELDFSINNGIDIKNDILKIAVIERHNNTNHKFIGFIKGLGLKKGAIASSVSHDSHNIVCVGTNEKDMQLAVNKLIENHGGYTIALDDKIIAELALPLAGLMSFEDVYSINQKNENLLKKALELKVDDVHFLFMLLSFVSLPVIPNLKITTNGLIDVKTQQVIPLFSK